MKTRTFIAPSLREAAAMVEEAMGSAAMVVDARRVPGPDGQGVLHELIVALADTEDQTDTSEGSGPGGADGQPAEPAASCATVYLPAGWAVALGEVQDRLRKMDQDLALWRQCTPDRDPQVRALIAAGVEPSIAVALVERARRQALPRGDLGLASPPDLARELAEALPVCSPLWDAQGRRIAALVGPTGTGKSRTVAKLAGLACFVHNRSVAVLTTDTHRIGGTEPLRTLCKEMGIPVRRAQTPVDVRRHLKTFAHRDLVLIDTPGCSPWDQDGLSYLDQMLTGLERHLVVPAIRDAESVRQLSHAFGGSRVRSVIITKLDEARGPGAALSAAWGSGAPVSHLCEGTHIPDDCKAAAGGHLHAGILVQAA